MKKIILFLSLISGTAICTDGYLDSSFGTNGKITTDFGVGGDDISSRISITTGWQDSRSRR